MSYTCIKNKQTGLILTPPRINFTLTLQVKLFGIANFPVLMPSNRCGIFPFLSNVEKYLFPQQGRRTLLYTYSFLYRLDFKSARNREDGKTYRISL